jgi:hypothetical protein
VSGPQEGPFFLSLISLFWSLCLNGESSELGEDSKFLTLGHPEEGKCGGDSGSNLGRSWSYWSWEGRASLGGRATISKEEPT